MLRVTPYVGTTRVRFDGRATRVRPSQPYPGSRVVEEITRPSTVAT